MEGPDRIELAKESLRVLTRNLNARDTVSLVTYASGVRDVLGPTPASHQRTILEAIEGLNTGGGTAMGSGLELAYRHALRGAQQGGVARVIVLTDGDTNIGANQSAESMLEAVRGYVKEGVTLTTVGFGMGNYRDSRMERLADSGNGQSVYIDSRAEAVKVFETNLSGTLQVIARDVKVQVTFDPRVVTRYRLLGYENRAVADADFRNDEVDGGEIGAGHSVTALYELELADGATAGSLGFVAVRGQRVGGVGPWAFEVEAAITRAVLAPTLAQASTELRFAAAVAGAADVLRGNGAVSAFSLEAAIGLARGASRELPEREEFVRLMQTAQRLQSPVVAGR
jgi:Ca-activated chloride channel family protein